jgi:hypothetical protein
VERTLDYAPVTLPGVSRRWPLATVAVVLALGGATFAVDGAAEGARAYLGTFGGCATGRREALFQLQVLTPLSFSLPAFGWWLAKRVGTGVVLCRSSLLAAVAAWVTSCVCAFK